MLRNKSSSFTRRKSITGLIFVTPFIIGALVFFVYPVIMSLIYSFGEIDSYRTFSVKFVGFANFQRALFEDTYFVSKLLQVIRDTLIDLPLITIFSIYIAILLNRDLPGKGIFRVIFFFPVVLGNGFVMEQLLEQGIDSGSMASVIEFLLPPKVVTYIGSEAAGVAAEFLNRVTLILWKSGVQIIITLSGLQSIPKALYEAADVDGANEWQSLFFITIPMLTPVILLNIIYTIMDTFTSKSNPVIECINAYFTAFNAQFEYSAAMGWIYLLFALALIGVITLFMKRFIANVSEQV
ncbi:MAG: sugar ABC transporter permease [Clostridia bacterium]|nr:sugar ABC transporter permease [Clostridia bacterium]